jgi:hypothetical protein
MNGMTGIWPNDEAFERFSSSISPGSLQQESVQSFFTVPRKIPERRERSLGIFIAPDLGEK